MPHMLVVSNSSGRKPDRFHDRSRRSTFRNRARNLDHADAESILRLRTFAKSSSATSGQSDVLPFGNTSIQISNQLPVNFECWFDLLHSSNMTAESGCMA